MTKKSSQVVHFRGFTSSTFQAIKRGQQLLKRPERVVHKLSFKKGSCNITQLGSSSSKLKMSSNRLCFALVLSCASVLVFFPGSVVPKPAPPSIPYQYKLFSRATNRYMVLSENKDVHAGGSDGKKL